MRPLSVSTNRNSPNASLVGEENAETVEEEDIQYLSTPNQDDDDDDDGLTPTSSLAVNIPNSTYFNRKPSSNGDGDHSTPSRPPSIQHSSTNSNSTNNTTTSSSSSCYSKISKSTDNSSISVPPSPSIAESELDSPSSMTSMSSFNSYIGKRSGDLADVEDLDLDDYGSNYHNNHEPELETVSEIDEEESSSSFCSGSGSVSDDQRTGVSASILDSDLDEKDLPNGNGNHGVEYHGRRRLGGLGGNHHHHGQQTNGLAHFHLSHFSPRHGGHGLSSSHARNHSGRLNRRTQQAQHQKGRIAELLEEGGEGVPSEPLTKGTPSSSSDYDGTTAINLSIPTKSSFSTTTEDATSTSIGNAEKERDPSADWGLEFPPPLPPQRNVSPSDTIPAVPSPLCECLSVDPDTNSSNITINGNEPWIPSTSNAMEESVETIRDPASSSRTQISRNNKETPTSTASKCTDGGASSPGSTPPSSPVLVRNNSRSRRSSSPGRSRPKEPLRPCFRRRTSAQSYTGGASHTRDSSSERESCSTPSSSGRGRGQVRFSAAPPQEARTHSPVEYDRKSCPISNRLSLEDVEELRGLKMEMGLLESKWKSMTACDKHKDSTPVTEKERIECKDCENPDDGIFRKARTSKSLLFRDSCGNTDAPVISGRESEDEINSDYNRVHSKQGYHSDSASNMRDKNGYQSSTYLSPNSSSSPYRRGSAPNSNSYDSSNSSVKSADLDEPGRLSAAAHLRLERERERERERRTMLGFNSRSSPIQKSKASNASQAAMIARFGLNTPPPPLPGTNSSGCGGSRPNPSRENSRENVGGYRPSPNLAESGNPSTSTSNANASSSSYLSPRSSSAPPTSRTPSEERVFRLSSAKQQIQDTVQHSKKREGEEESRGRSNSISPSQNSQDDDEEEAEEEEDQLQLDRSPNRRDPSTDTIVASSPNRGRTAFRSSTTTPLTPAVTITSPPDSASQQIEESEAESDYGYSSYKPSYSPGSSWKSNNAAKKNIPQPTSVYSSTNSSTPTISSFPTGYDSPASEFYESGSEYDLIG